MRELQSIEVVRGASHVVAPRAAVESMRFRLSEADLPIDEDVGAFLAAHVDGGLHDAQAKAARFVIREPGHASVICERLLGSRPRLAELSAQLARRLHEIAQGDERVSDATLAVLLCQAKREGGDAPVGFLALLKLDPSDAFHPIVDTDASGRERVRFEVDHNVFPTRGERLQKCAFLERVDPAAEFELLVVDRQRPGAIVSRFWMADFLGAEEVLDSVERTKRFARGLRLARNTVAPQLDAAHLEALDRVIDGAVVSETVNLDSFRDSLPVPASVREQIDATLSSSLPDREFALDAQVSSDFLRRRTFIADNGIRLSVPGDFVDNIRVEDLDTDDSSENRRRRVSFETRKWETR